MKLENSNWKFDESVVPIFDEHVNQSVPLYCEIHNLITDISGWFLEEECNVYDIGTSTGKVINELITKYENKIVRYIGIDSSRDMCERAKENLKQFNNVSIHNEDVNNDSFIFENACLITSVLTMQFIPERKRQALTDKIYDGLNKGAAYIMVEKVVGSNARFNEIWTELYHELKIKNGLSEEHVFAKSRAIRGVMRPYTADENIHMLEKSGFKDVDVFFKWNNFVGFIAIK